MTQAINQALAIRSINLGERIAGDATLIQAKPQDREAAYNGYYKKHCYLVHRLVCAATNLTLEWLVTPGNVDEGKLMMPLVAKAFADGLQPKEAVFDNGYASYWNYEIANLLGLKLRIGFRRRAFVDALR